MYISYILYENIQIICANTEAYNQRNIKDESNLPEIITGMNRNFASIEKPQWTDNFFPNCLLWPFKNYTAFRI